MKAKITVIPDYIAGSELTIGLEKLNKANGKGFGRKIYLIDLEDKAGNHSGFVMELGGFARFIKILAKCFGLENRFISWLFAKKCPRNLSGNERIKNRKKVINLGNSLESGKKSLTLNQVKNKKVKLIWEYTSPESVDPVSPKPPVEPPNPPESDPEIPDDASTDFKFPSRVYQPTLKETKEAIKNPKAGKMKGIQGENNSCAFCSLIYSLFSTSDVLDEVLLPNEGDDDKAKEIRALINEIVQGVRHEGGLVAGEKAVKLRNLVFDQDPAGRPAPYRDTNEVLSVLKKQLNIPDDLVDVVDLTVALFFRDDSIVKDGKIINVDRAIEYVLGENQKGQSESRIKKDAKVLIVKFVNSPDGNSNGFDTIPTRTGAFGAERRLIGTASVKRRHFKSTTYTEDGTHYYYDSMQSKEINQFTEYEFDPPLDFLIQKEKKLYEEGNNYIQAFNQMPPNGIHTLKDSSLYYESVVRKATEEDIKESVQSLSMAVYIKT